MSIRVRTLFLIGVVLTVSTIVLYQVVAHIQMASYRELERSSAEQDLERVSRIILTDLDDLGFITSDYGSWDQTYDYVSGLRPDYPEENFSLLTLSDLQWNFVVVVNRTGSLEFSEGVNLSTGRRMAVPDDLIAYLNPGGQFLASQEGAEDVNGFLQVGDRVVFGSAAPILRSDDSGPKAGYLLMGRYLDRKKRTNLANRMQLDMSFQGRGADGFSERSQSIVTQILESSVSHPFETEAPLKYLEYVDDQMLRGHVLFSDPDGQPILLTSASIPRTIYQAGKQSLTILLMALAAAGAVLVLTVLVLLDRIVLRRLAMLGQDVSRIGQTQDLGLRVAATGSDEFSHVGQAVNWMLEQVETSNQKLAEEHERAEGLLLNILPEPIAERLKTNPKSIAQSYDEVSILFADIVGFTEMSAAMPAAELVDMLNGLFSRFDDLAMQLGLEKIKTIGDAYMVVSGLPEPDEHHADKLAGMALKMIETTRSFSQERGLDLSLRVGINSGVVVAGVIGKNKFIYDLWGDAVNLASRMESSGQNGAIQLTKATRDRLSYRYDVVERGEVDIKGRGVMTTYLLNGLTDMGR
ncbi:adenylate/guanylate cyclase domain-containing protein [Tropicibacter sp. Alg240-R139]|uniref:adenylate/guanylate cyclase domain-containing protein n=1 Tax=Tropicibacter sp. Alg240-R139 TaxID=2305991 RepID=UPI0013DE843B|nr:adenylate/guanylate cyclase domain-containing protein [Tropicibacter sp. Alg240-R139]